MVVEENRVGADDMVIDEPTTHNIQRSVVPSSEFDQNNLRVYYGTILLLQFRFSLVLVSIFLHVSLSLFGTLSFYSSIISSYLLSN